MMDLVVILRLAYLGAAAAVLFIHFIPAFRNRFLAYGPRIADGPAVPVRPKEQSRYMSSTVASLDRLADIKVPHSWFASFYVVSVLASMIWTWQLSSKGTAFQLIADLTNPQNASMSYAHVLLALTLFFLHGMRRVYECFVISKPSQSRMWFGHWLLGISFYLATSVALWIEGISALQLQRTGGSHFASDMLDVRSVLSITLFILASGLQHSCHVYLASLKSSTKDNCGYKLPQHPAFVHIIAPHYTAECLLYLALAIFTAPQGKWMNWTLVCALAFVAMNLGVTANGTKAWYESKFGKKAVEGRWRILPFVF